MKFLDAILFREPSANTLRAHQIAESARKELEHRASAEAYAVDAATHNVLADMHAQRRERLIAGIAAVQISEPGLLRRLMTRSGPIALGNLQPGITVGGGHADANT